LIWLVNDSPSFLIDKEVDANFKIKASAQELCAGKSMLFAPILDEIFQYKFDEEPHYDKIVFMF
jgi:hypothetical protein